MRAKTPTTRATAQKSTNMHTMRTSITIAAIALGIAANAQTKIKGHIYTDAGSAAVVTTPSAGVEYITLSAHGRYRVRIDKDSTAMIVFAWPGYVTKVLTVDGPLVNRTTRIEIQMERGYGIVLGTLSTVNGNLTLHTSAQ